MSQEVDPKTLEKFGEVKEFSYPKLVLAVDRKAISATTAKVLDELPVADLNIEESSIEDIIRELFTGKNYA